ncbi:hypothetical protein SXM_2531 [Shewanella xiamenensis]|nr:hypothetical protein SXM_2531 [Shewanella xiamenensis]
MKNKSALNSVALLVQTQIEAKVAGQMAGELLRVLLIFHMKGHRTSYNEEAYPCVVSSE